MVALRKEAGTVTDRAGELNCDLPELLRYSSTGAPKFYRTTEIGLRIRMCL